MYGRLPCLNCRYGGQGHAYPSLPTGKAGGQAGSIASGESAQSDH
ncbi:MAG: hypothetical protein WC599_05890 [Bacteroidales bacterium]